MYSFIRQVAVIFVIPTLLAKCENNDGLFKTDIGDQMTIGLSDKGYKSIKLKCGSDSMLIELETDGDFDGVIYTRGSYHDKNSACFLNPEPGRRQRSFSFKFPLNQCNTQNNNEIYSNTLVLQHDKELIMPGDAAFHLECDYSKPRDVTVNANLQNGKQRVISRITLADADPAFKKKPARDKRSSVQNLSGTVILTADFLRKRVSASK